MEILRTRLDGSEAAAPAIRMSSGGWPHCLWVEGNSVRYARWFGGEWVFLGGASLALEFASKPTVFPNSLDIDESSRPHAVVCEGGKLKSLWWDGSAWNTEDIAGLSGKEIAGAACCWMGEAVVAAAFWTSAWSALCVYRKSGSVWSESRVDLGKLDFTEADVVARKVGRVAYVFWKASSGGSGWVGHMMYDLRSDLWVGRPSKVVALSQQNADILGLDFIASVEPFSSSSSGSASSSSSSDSSSSESSTQTRGLGYWSLGGGFLVR